MKWYKEDVCFHSDTGDTYPFRNADFHTFDWTAKAAGLSDTPSVNNQDNYVSSIISSIKAVWTDMFIN